MGWKAEIEEVIPALIGGGVGHSGQVCAAITRVLIQRDDYEASVIISLVIEMAKLGPLSQNRVDYIARVHDLATSYATEVQLTDPAGFSLSWLSEPE